MSAASAGGDVRTRTRVPAPRRAEQLVDLTAAAATSATGLWPPSARGTQTGRARRPPVSAANAAGRAS